MQNLKDFEGYSETEVKNALHARYGPRQIRFRYDVLNVDYIKKAELNKVESCTVSMSAFARIKRTATMKVAEEFFPPRFEVIGGVKTLVDNVPKVNYLQDMIQPFVEVQMPDGGWIEFPQGIFYPSTPERQTGVENVYREIELYDGLIRLDEDKIRVREYFTAGYNYVQAVKEMLQSAGVWDRFNITRSGETLSKEREWEPGTPKLDIINDLLESINYTPIWCDADGVFTSSPYLPPPEREVEYTYLDDEISVIHSGASEELDLYNIANSWVVVKSNAEEAPMSARMINNSPDSPSSTISRGRIIADFREMDEVSSQTVLDNYVRRIAYEASQIYGKVKFETAIMPFHEYHNMIYIGYGQLGVGDDYTETSWEIEMKAGGRMTHEARKVVFIG